MRLGHNSLDAVLAVLSRRGQLDQLRHHQTQRVPAVIQSAVSWLRLHNPQRILNGTMNLDSIQAFFAAPPPTYLNAELAVCFVLPVLLQQDTYAKALIQGLGQAYPAYRMSDTILDRALTFLEAEGVVRSDWQNVPGRGRPRRMLTLVPQHREQAAALAKLWHAYTAQYPAPLGLNYYDRRPTARAR